MLLFCSLRSRLPVSLGSRAGVFLKLLAEHINIDIPTRARIKAGEFALRLHSDKNSFLNILQNHADRFPLSASNMLNLIHILVIAF